MATISQARVSDFFVKEKFGILIKNSLNFVPKGPFDNIPALFQIMDMVRIGSDNWLVAYSAPSHYLNQC